MPCLQNKIVALYFSNRNHDSLLDIVLKSLKALDCKIILFLDEGISQSVYPISDILFQQYISNKKFVPNRVFNAFDSADFVIIDELYSFRELLSFGFNHLKRPNLMIIHDCNTWLAPRWPKKFIQKIKYLMTKRVKSKIGFFGVAGENMLIYTTQVLNVKNLTLIPFRYADFNIHKDLSGEFYKPDTKIRVVVPGMISKRRNYEELLKAVCRKELKGKVDLILLGKPNGDYGQKIVTSAKSLVEQGYNIRYWDEFIPNDIFDAEIRNAHLLFSYFETTYITNNGQTEVYGVSKETGITSLMYNKAKVGLLPREFNQMETIKDQTITYENIEDITDILLNVFNGTIDLRTKVEMAISKAKSMNPVIIVENLNESYRQQIMDRKSACGPM